MESSRRRRGQRLRAPAQRATAKLPRTSGAAPGGQALLDAIAEAAARLLDAPDARILRAEGDRLHLVARHGTRRPPGSAGAGLPIRRTTVPGRAFLDGRTVQLGADLATPLGSDGAPLGVIALRRATARPLAPRQLGALEAFAAQATIALRQLEACARELTETLSHQAAAGEIIRAISASPTEMQRVFDMIAGNAVRLCDGQFGGVFQFDGQRIHLLAQHGLGAEGVRVYAHAFPRPPGRDSAIGRAILDRAIVHIPDVQDDPEYGLTALAATGSMRCIVAVPVLREGQPIGGVVAWRAKPEPFSDKQIELLKTFADQTLIAIENTRLVAALETRNRDLSEALEQQTATAEILRAISGSPTDIQPVLDTVARAAARFCGATDVLLLRLDGQTLRGAAGVGQFAENLANQVGGSLALLRIPVTRGSVTGRAVVERHPVHVHDLAAEPEDEFPEGRDLQRRFGHRTMVAAPLLREGTPLGTIALFREVVDPFSDKQLELLRLFADQAVIAIENVRLFTELEVRNRDLTETLEQQTATGDILRVISSSPTDVQPVFDTIAQNARRLCDAEFCAVFRYDGRLLHFVAHDGVTAEGVEAWNQLFPVAPGRGSGAGRAVLSAAVEQIPDVAADPDYSFGELARIVTFRSLAAVPILRDGRPIGAITVNRSQTGFLPTRQVDLLRTFADQAVIAIENVRLFAELESKNRDLTDSLEQQTATGEILRVISSSPTDAQPVFDIIARNAVRLCQAAFAYVFRYDGTLMHVVAHHNLTSEALAALERQWPMRPDPRSVPARAVLERRVVHVEDVLDAPDHPYLATSRALGIRTMLTVPMMREGEPIGAIAVYRQEVQAFSEHQIGLVSTFASQAVIAIENVRLFKELEVRNRDLTETLEQQTATGEILRVISSSPTDVQPVFDTIARSALRLCDARWSAVTRFDGHLIELASHHGLTDPSGIAAIERAFPRTPSPHGATDRAIIGQVVGHYPDVLEDRDYQFQGLARAAGYRSMLAVPMIREGQAVGAITVAGATARTFSDRQIELLKTFADQAVIAIENVRLFTELESRNRDLTETLEQQTATSEILRVISSSPTDAQPVFETIARSAKQLCEAEFCAVFRFDGQLLHFVAHHGLAAEGVEATRQAFPAAADRGSAAGRSVLSAAVEQIPDVTADSDYTFGTLARIATFRSIVAVPMVRDGVPIGAITVRRVQAGVFPDRQIALLQTFAAQAVIAVENVRLFQELEARNRDLVETLEQQTATSEILRVISSSPTDVQPVFDIIGERAKQLCDAAISVVSRFDGELLHLVSLHGVAPTGADAIRNAFPMRLDDETISVRVVRTRAVVHVTDVLADVGYGQKSTARASGYRGCLGVPMVREGQVTGVIFVARTRPGLFADAQVELLKTFADQAVIAVENVRLFQELDARNRDLTETLEQQTATGEILRAISSSPTDAQPVFDTIARSAMRLCEGGFAVVARYDGENLHLAAHSHARPEGVEVMRQLFPMRPSRINMLGRAILTGAVVHVSDVQDDPDYGLTLSKTLGNRSSLAVPMLRDGLPIGSITVCRFEVRPFSEAHVALLQTFADQAVIAVQNVRLFKELEVRNRDLTETLEQQTATGEILRVISSSPTDAQPVFDTIAESAKRLCGAEFCLLYRYDGTLLHFVAHHGLSPEGVDAVRRAYPMAPARTSAAARAVLSGVLEHIPDVDADSDYRHGALARTINFKSIVAVPMVRDGIPIGTIAVARVEAGPFSDRQLELLKTFADQAVIAVENVRLFTELESRTHELTRSVGELRALGEVSQAVSSTLDLGTVLETIVSRAVQLSASDVGIAYEFDEVSQRFDVRATHQITPEHLAAVRNSPIRLGEGAVGRAGVSRGPVQVADTEPEWQLIPSRVRAVHAREGIRALLAVPLVREGQLLGGLVIERRELTAFSPQVVATLQAFATQSVLAIHNAGLFREIQRQKQYADAIVETSPVAIATLDLDGKVVGWNPGAERLFGYTPTEALGRPLEDLVATADTREEVRAGLRQGLRGERRSLIGRRARKDGTLVDVEISATPVIVGGVEVGIVATYHDITDLLRARREAETANEAKSAFLATMSHEIRTPMNAVIGMSGLLLGTSLNDEQREYAEIVRQSGDALLTVINDILDFSKIEAGKLELEAQPFDLRECVESAVDLVAARATEKGLDLAYLVGDGTPSLVVGDVTRLRQVLLNLLSNAVKFTERGEVVLSVATHRLDDPAAPPELTFSVRDTGIGIAPDRLGRLFQSFSQVDASTTRRYGGTGLGLAISQRLTELMGGRIGVTSEVGVGSDFRFTIRAPVAEGPLPARRDLSGVQPSLRGKQVLVVDDNATNRRIVTTHLDAWGMQARATGSPGEALGWIQADERFDLAILDMHMPEMDGVALARALRAHPAGAALPLVLFTSLGRREARAEEEGFAAYLHKPIKPSQLFDALVTVLAERPVHVPERGVGRGELDPDLAARHPLRILLAEDNVVNQKVALRLLGQMGYRADVAANGLEAVDAVGRQRYDVVLMDVQMPELDGFEASREINRRWPGSRRPRIVAMTANAMQGDRELCAAAGMDDYVAKPIRVEELVAALERSPRRADAPARAEPGEAGRADGAGRRARRRPSGSPAAATAAPGADRAPAGAIDRPTFDRLAATMGGPFLAELIGTFLEDAPALVVALRAGLAAADVDVFRRAAHSLKSNCDTLGALGLAALARELETRARAGTLAGADDRVTELAGAYDAVARELEELRHDLPA